jgi:hypothetical protein
MRQEEYKGFLIVHSVSKRRKKKGLPPSLGMVYTRWWPSGRIFDRRKVHKNSGVDGAFERAKKVIDDLPF